MYYKKTYYTYWTIELAQQILHRLFDTTYCTAYFRHQIFYKTYCAYVSYEKYFIQKVVRIHQSFYTNHYSFHSHFETHQGKDN